MRTFTILDMDLKQGLKFSSVFNSIESTVTYNKTIFEVGDIKDSDKTGSLLYDETFKKYSFIISDADKEETILISNLDENWKVANSNNNESPSKESVYALCKKMDKSTLRNYYTFMLGFDEIEWSNGKSNKGTYGFEKAESQYKHGYNYLSNSIIVYNEGANRRIKAYICYENDIVDKSVLDNIIEMIGGTIKNVRVLCAPSDKEERYIWDQKYEIAQTKFKNMLSNFDSVYDTLPYDLGDYRILTDYSDEYIPASKIANSILKADGWEKIKNKNNKTGTSYRKQFTDFEFMLWVAPLHGGHYLQTGFFYQSKYFCFPHKINYERFVEDRISAERYFHNTVQIMKYIEDCLK